MARLSCILGVSFYIGLGLAFTVLGGWWGVGIRKLIALCLIFFEFLAREGDWWTRVIPFPGLLTTPLCFDESMVHKTPLYLIPFL